MSDFTKDCIRSIAIVIAGEKWYEVVVDGKTYDARPFAPFSFYLLAAEYMNPNNNLKNIDFADVAAGINRISGTGLVLVEVWIKIFLWRRRNL